VFSTPQRNRRLLFVIVAGALAVTTALLAFTFIGAAYLVHGGRMTFSDQLPADLPPELVTCPHFAVSHSVVATTDSGGTRYEVDGDCPLNLLTMQERYVADLEYHGWTVHTDDSGNVVAYAYGRREQLSATLAESSSNDNQTTLQVEMVTGIDSPPDGFPSPPSR
jgi:hypothetical protein